MVEDLQKLLKVRMVLLKLTFFIVIFIGSISSAFSQINCTANAGGDAIICGTSTTLNGSVSGTLGTLNSPLWTFVSGPSGATPVIASPNNLTTNVTGMTADGNYTFRLTRNCGNGIAVSDVTITAHPRPASFTAGDDVTNICATNGSTSLAGVIPPGFTGMWRAVNIYNLGRFATFVSTNSQFSNTTSATPVFSLINKSNHEIDPAYYAILRITSLDGNCSYEDTAIVRFIPNPQIVPVNRSVCRTQGAEPFIDLDVSANAGPNFSTAIAGSAGTLVSGNTVTMNVISTPAGGTLGFNRISENRRMYVTGLNVPGVYRYTLTVSNACGIHTTDTITYTLNGFTPGEVNFQPVGHGTPEQLTVYASGGSGGEVHCISKVGTITPERFYFDVNEADDPANIWTIVTTTGIAPPGGFPTVGTVVGAGLRNRWVDITPPEGGWQTGTYRFNIQRSWNGQCPASQSYYIHVSDNNRPDVEVSDVSVCYPGTGTVSANITLPAIYKGVVNSSYFQDLGAFYNFSVVSKPAGSGNPTYLTSNLRSITSTGTTISNLTMAGDYVFRITAFSGNGAGPILEQEYACSGTSMVDTFVVHVENPINANAGSDQNQSCVNSFNLQGNHPGTGTGVWTRVSSPVGSTPVITNINAPSTTVTGVNIAGTYTYRWTITSQFGTCTSNDDVSFVINTISPDAPTVITEPSQCSAPTGSITVTAPLGAGYDYSIDGVNFQSGTVFSGLIPGAYNIIARNGGITGCRSVETMTVVQPSDCSTPFPCDNSAYFLSGSLTNGQLTIYDLVSGAQSAPIATFSGTSNGLAYNPYDNLLYLLNTPSIGSTTARLNRVDANGVVTILNIPNLSSVFSIGDNPPAATITSNGYYVAKVNSSSANNRYIVIDVNPTRETYLQMVNPANSFAVATAPYYKTTNASPMAMSDFAYNPIDGLIYSVTTPGSIASFNFVTGAYTVDTTVTLNGTPIGTGTYASTFIDVTGSLYVISQAGRAYKINISTGVAVLLSAAPVSNNADGTNCPAAVLSNVITGNVFNDGNGNTVINTGESFDSLPVPMTVYLVDSNGIIVDSAHVAPNGSYTLNSASNQTYTIELSTVQYPIGTNTGTTPISTTPSTGWATTGENGTDNTGSGDGSPDGKLIVSVGTSDIDNQNFGIRQCPLVPTLLVTNPSCLSTGTVTISSPTGTGYTYSKDNITFQSSPYFSGLSVGNHTFYVKMDGRECISSAGVTLTTEPCVPSYCSDDLYWNDEDRSIGMYNVTTNVNTTLCTHPDILLGDIAMDQYGQMWGVEFGLVSGLGQLYRIDVNTCNFVPVAMTPVMNPNSLSVLPDGTFLMGSGSQGSIENNVVYRYNPATDSFSIWNEFGTTIPTIVNDDTLYLNHPNGDFIYLDGFIYVLWFDASADINAPHVYKVTVDENYNYVSHEDLGAIQRFSYGLAKVNGELYAASSIGFDGGDAGNLIKIPLPNVEDWTIVHADISSFFYGATSYQESQAIDLPVLSSYDINNTCPDLAVNLNALLADTPPAGYSLVWFTNDTHSGTPLTEEESSNVGVGAYYYAYFYNEEVDCYSPVSNAVLVTIDSCPVITGSIFNDANGNTIINTGEAFTSLPVPLYVYLVDSNGIIVDSAHVAPNGSYTLNSASNQTYTIELSTVQYPIGTNTGTTPISTTPSTGWTTTGENGTDNTGLGDGSPDGKLIVSVGTSDIDNQNFGIRQCPLVPTLLVTNPSCLNTGAITITSPLGSEYTYSKDNITFQESPYFSGLSVGNHTFYVKMVGTDCSSSAGVPLVTETCVPSYCSDDLYWNDNNQSIGMYNVTTNVNTTLCTNPDILLGDIAMDQYGQMWGVEFDYSPMQGHLYRIDVNTCNFVPVAMTPVINPNSLSVLPDGTFLMGSGLQGDSASNVVYRYNPVTDSFSIWQEIGVAGNIILNHPNGDFIYLDGSIYVLWFNASIDSNAPRIYKVTVDANYNYVSHEDLGSVQPYSFGLAKVNGELYAASSLAAPAGSIIKIPLPNVVDYTIVHSDITSLFYGATSYQETQVIDLPVLSSYDISNTCPDLTVNLNTLLTETPPAGYSLVWFTNDTHSGTPLTETEASNVGVGAYYYAYFYNADADCYSPASNAVLVTIDACPVITGNVFNDGNGNTTIEGGEEFISLPVPLYVYLVDSNGIVVDSAHVAPDGSYTLSASQNQNYTIELSTVQYPIGTNTNTTSINTTPPAGWVTTGENGTNNTGSGDGFPDGKLSVSVGTSDVDNQNFGIQRPPVADNKTYHVPNHVFSEIPPTRYPDINTPGARYFTIPTDHSMLTGYTHNGYLTGRDAEDCQASESCNTGSTFVLDSLYATTLLFYDFGGETAVRQLAPGDTIKNYDPSKLVIYALEGSGMAIPVGFTYSLVDNAGFASSPATYTIFTESALPVELLHFTATVTDCKTILNWATASELNNDYFEVERSADAKVWKSIGRINGNGTSSARHDYDFEDADISAGILYYRLKQVDFDGTTEYHKTISVDGKNCSIYEVKVYPNPASVQITVEIQGGILKDASRQIILTDVGGREILQVNNSEDISKIDVSNLSAGTYFVRILSGKEVIIIKQVTVVK